MGRAARIGVLRSRLRRCVASASMLLGNEVRADGEEPKLWLSHSCLEAVSEPVEALEFGGHEFPSPILRRPDSLEDAESACKVQSDLLACCCDGESRALVAHHPRLNLLRSFGHSINEVREMFEHS